MFYYQICLALYNNQNSIGREWIRINSIDSSRSVRPHKLNRAREMAMKSSVLFIGIVFLLISIPVVVFGSGFALGEQGGRYLSTGAQGVAFGQDPHTIYYNPAGMTQLEGIQLCITGSMFIFPTAEMQREPDIFATNDNYPGYIEPYTDPETGLGVYKKASLQNPVGLGGGFFGIVLSDVIPVEGLSIGLVANTVFGSALEYPKDRAPNAYWMESVFLVTFHIVPSVAYEITDWLSVGAGIGPVFAFMDMTMNIDPYTTFFAPYDPQSIYYARSETYTDQTLNPYTGNNDLAGAPNPYYDPNFRTDDPTLVAAGIPIIRGFQEDPNYAVGTHLAMDAVSFTWNASFLLHFKDLFLDDQFNFGFQYGFFINLKMKGDAELEFTDDFLPLVSLAGITQNKIKMPTTIELQLPQFVRFGFAYTVPTRIMTIAVEFTWMQWSVWDEYRIKLPKDPDKNPMADPALMGLTEIVYEKNWKDGYTIRGGVQIHLVQGIIQTDAITGFDFALGTYFDSNVIPDEYIQLDYPAHRNVGFTFGFNFDVTDYLGFDYGFLKYFFPDRDVKRNYQVPSIRGFIDIDMIVMTFSLRLKF